jgi:hypothetical protein
VTSATLPSQDMTPMLSGRSARRPGNREYPDGETR